MKFAWNESQKRLQKGMVSPGEGGFSGAVAGVLESAESDAATVADAGALPWANAAYADRISKTRSGRNSYYG